MKLYFIKVNKYSSILFCWFALFLSANYFAQEPLFKNPLSERIANYNIFVTLDNIEHQLKGKEMLNWENTSGNQINELRFHLYLNAFKNNRSTFMIESGGHHRGFGKKENVWGWCKINKMKIVNGEEITDMIEFIQPDDTNKYDQTVIRVPLKSPLLPGEEINLEINFTSKLPNIFARTGFADDYYLVGQWFPKIGVYEKAEKLGTKTGKWNCHQFHANSEFFADFGLYNVNITLPEKFVVGATGILQQEIKNKNGTKTLNFHAEDVIDFAWTAYPKFKIKETTWKHVKVKVLMPPEHFMYADKYLEAAVASLKYLDENVGKYPYPNLTIVDPPINASGSGGMEYPTFITGMSIWGIPDFVRIIEVVTAHEFTHNYFMGMLASNEFEEPWMDEGFTQYFETRIMDATYGPQKSILNILGFHSGDFQITRSGYVSMKNPHIASNRPFAWQFPRGAYGVLTYNKTATWLTTLERMLGKKTMTEIIKTYFSRWSFKHPTGKDFINVVNEVVNKNFGNKFGENMNWFFDEILYGTGICDYKVQAIRNYRANNKKGIFNDSLITDNDSADNDINKKYNPEVTVHRAGEIKLPVEVLIHFKDKTRILKHWNGQSRTKTYSFKNTAQVDWVKVDPNYKITLDVNLANNSLVVKPKSRVAEKYAAKFLFWLENVMLAFASLF